MVRKQRDKTDPPQWGSQNISATALKTLLSALLLHISGVLPFLRASCQMSCHVHQTLQRIPTPPKERAASRRSRIRRPWSSVCRRGSDETRQPSGLGFLPAARAVGSGRPALSGSQAAPGNPGDPHQRGARRAQPAPQGGQRARQGDGNFQAGDSALFQGASVAERCRLFDSLAVRHSVAWRCACWRCPYYVWRQRQEAPGKQAAENVRLTPEIKDAF